MATQRELQRLGLFQDQANAIGDPRGSRPAGAWISQGDSLWTIGTSESAGMDGNGVWHEAGDTIISQYEFQTSGNTPSLTSRGGIALPMPSAQADMRDRLDQTLAMLRQTHQGFSPDQGGTIPTPGHARFTMPGDGIRLPYGWIEANRNAAAMLMHLDPMGTRASLLQDQIGRPDAVVAWFLEANSYDLHLVDWERNERGEFTSFDFTHLQYDDSGSLPDIQIIAHNEHPTVIRPGTVTMRDLALASRRIVDEYQGMRAHDGGNVTLAADQIAYRQHGIALPGDTPHLIVAGTGQPADEWNQLVSRTASGLLASRPNPSHRQENTIMADNDNVHGTPTAMSLQDANGTPKTITATIQGVDERATISVDGRPVGHIIQDPQGGWNTWAYRHAEDGTVTGTNEPKRLETREQAISALAQPFTGIADPTRYQQLAAAISEPGRAEQTIPQQAKPASWPKVNFPNRLVTSYQHTGKDGRVWDKFIIHIPSGTKINGMPIDGWNIDQFASKRASEDKINGRDVTISFNPERPVELWRKNGDTRETLTIDNAWDLCKAVKAARTAFKEAQEAKREQARNTPAAGHPTTIAPALPEQISDAARSLARTVMDGRTAGGDLDKACEKFAQYHLEGRYDPDKAAKAIQRITDRQAIEHERANGNTSVQRVSDITSLTPDDRKTAAILVLAGSDELINAKIDELADRGVGKPEIIRANHEERGIAGTQTNPAPTERHAPDQTGAAGIDPWTTVQPAVMTKAPDANNTPGNTARDEFDTFGEPAETRSPKGVEPAKDGSKADFMGSIMDRAKAKMAESRTQTTPPALDRTKETR